MNKAKAKPKLKIKSAKFINIPKRRKIAGLKQFVFDSDGKILVTLYNNQKIYLSIPRGFICDSTSLPWAVDSAGDVHDWGYCVQGAKYGYTKAFWDTVFYHLMRDIGMPKWRCKVRFYGVRLFGGLAYNKRRAEKYQALRMYSVSNVINKWGV